MRRGAGLEAMIETPGPCSLIHALGPRTLFLSRGTSMRVRRFSTMQTEPIVDRVPARESTLPTAAVVSPRSTRRATARRASNRRATARQHKDDIDGRIFEYVKG